MPSLFACLFDVEQDGYEVEDEICYGCPDQKLAKIVSRLCIDDKIIDKEQKHVISYQNNDLVQYLSPIRQARMEHLFVQ